MKIKIDFDWKSVVCLVTVQSLTHWSLRNCYTCCILKVASFQLMFSCVKKCGVSDLKVPSSGTSSAIHLVKSICLIITSCWAKAVIELWHPLEMYCDVLFVSFFRPRRMPTFSVSDPVHSRPHLPPHSFQICFSTSRVPLMTALSDVLKPPCWEEPAQQMCFHSENVQRNETLFLPLCRYVSSSCPSFRWS